jgi:hypothetical protein
MKDKVTVQVRKIIDSLAVNGYDQVAAPASCIRSSNQTGSIGRAARSDTDNIGT